MAIQDILGGGLPAGLLTPEQETAAQQRAQNAGLLNLAFGLMQASRGQPGQGKPSLGQIIGQAGPVGVAGYQQSFDKTLKDLMTGMQVQELRRKQAEQATLDKAREEFQARLKGATTMQPTMQDVLATQSNIDPALLEGMSAQDVIGQAPKTRAVTDEGAANQAVLDYLRVASPTEYAKLIAKEPKALPADMQGYQLAVSQGYGGTFLDYQKDLRKAGASNVTVTAGEKKLTEVLGTKAAERLDASLAAAQESQNTLQNIAELRPVIASGVFSGPLSGAPRAVAQLASSLGVAGATTEELLKNTAVAMQGLAKFELSAAAAMRGQGAITENERMLIQRAAAGRLDQFTSTEVQSLLDAMEKTAKFKIEAHNKQLGVLRNSKNEEVRGLLPLYELQSAPVAAPKAGPKRYNPATGRVE